MQRIPVILFGVGGVGRALLKRIIATRETVAVRAGCRFDLVALADSRSWLLRPSGLEDPEINRIVREKTGGRSVGEPQEERLSHVALLEAAAAAGVEGALVVDLTAVQGMEPAMDKALELGYRLVLANKKALAGPWVIAKNYFNNPRVRHESTVGGGQPVISTLRYLMDIQDTALELGGQFSGTLGYICQQMEQGTPFSGALAEAKANGFTEPDPRDDLSGEDVMRKTLILARMVGWPLEARDIRVESLYPPSLAGLPVADFMHAAASLDREMAQRVEAARASDKVLRYLARVTPQGGRVGLMSMAKSDSLANLKFISFRTHLYNDEPLLICGKGAGVEMTAGGVLGDMIGLARERD